MCFISLVLTKDSNSSLVYTDLLSETIICENLWVINQCGNDLIVNLELVLFPIMAFNPTITENIFPCNGPAQHFEV